MNLLYHTELTLYCIHKKKVTRAASEHLYTPGQIHTQSVAKIANLQDHNTLQNCYVLIELLFVDKVHTIGFTWLFCFVKMQCQGALRYM